jgi:NAD(P)H dehydrogenase (quinone)
LLATTSLRWSTRLRIFILYANPVAASFGATLHKEVVTTLRSYGHEIDDCDLYTGSFDPVMRVRSMPGHAVRCDYLA